MQFLSNTLVTCTALGGSSKRSDAEDHEILSRGPLILFSLDTDSAGAVAYQWWKRICPQLKLWLSSAGKIPGDVYIKGLDTRKWIEAALKIDFFS